MKKLILLLMLCSLLIVGCSNAIPQATPTLQATATEPLPTETKVPTATLQPSATPLPTNTPTPEPTLTPTLIPFTPFPEIFRFYRYWFDGDKTVVYFLNAERETTMYAVINGLDFVCNPDPKYPRQMICEASKRFEPGEALEIELFADEAHKQSVWLNSVAFAKTVPDNVQCETEYRMYAAGCSYHSSCYDLQGNYLYSEDYYPGDPNDPWVPWASCP
ncbi:MAG TPA: hypothetical protein VLR89_03570 [Anaerolineaceae bacterium]|nr:hypothetical protein [Anaerolineaceae bacterium]